MSSLLPQPFTSLFKRSWVQHLAFWVGLILIFTLFRALRADRAPWTWMSLVLEMVPFSGVAVAVYLNLKLLLPRFLTQRKYLPYILALLLITFTNAVIVYILFKILAPVLIDIPEKPHPNHWLFFPAFMTMQIIFTIITSFFHFLRENIRLSEIALTVKEIESHRLEAELNSLKAQINPHFLFNTLNNIYSYSLLDSEKTPEMILKLSSLLNYIIYECQEEWVSIHKEIEFIKDYVTLEKLRVEESVSITLDLPVDLDEFKIAPLLFVPFLENAFKHGASVNVEAPKISFSLQKNDDSRITFISENPFDDHPVSGSEDRKGGIGLVNVRKRLDLIYPQRHELRITTAEGMYRVELTLDLAGASS